MRPRSRLTFKSVYTCNISQNVEWSHCLFVAFGLQAERQLRAAAATMLSCRFVETWCRLCCLGSILTRELSEYKQVFQILVISVQAALKARRPWGTI